MFLFDKIVFNISIQIRTNNASLDSEGYYMPKIGEVIKDRYRVISLAGKGVFSCVVKAQDLSLNSHSSLNS